MSSNHARNEKKSWFMKLKRKKIMRRFAANINTVPPELKMDYNILATAIVVRTHAVV